MKTNLNIVNEHLQFRKVSLIEPTKNYYLHMAAEIDHSLFPFFLTTSSRKKNLINKAKKWCQQLETDNEIVSAVVFKASLIPPGQGQFLKEKSGMVLIAKYDFAILIEATSIEKINELKNTSGYQEIENILKEIATHTHCITATNTKHIGAVNHKKQGVFLFNYFFADFLEQNIGVWEYTAGWFQQETGLDNSTVLLPIEQEQSKYTIINHCRWDKMTDILPALLFKKPFHTYVLDNFYANKVAAMPVLYKMA